MEKSSKTASAAPKKDKLLLVAMVCVLLILVVMILIQSFQYNGFPANETTISQIISTPTNWEDKTVKVEGTVEEIPLGIIQPFNYWLSDRQNQTIRIGLTWHSDADLRGQSLTVVGVVKKGYAWVNPNYPRWWTYYIEANSIYQD